MNWTKLKKISNNNTTMALLNNEIQIIIYQIRKTSKRNRIKKLNKENKKLRKERTEKKKELKKLLMTNKSIENIL